MGSRILGKVSDFPPQRSIHFREEWPPFPLLDHSLHGRFKLGVVLDSKDPDRRLRYRAHAVLLAQSGKPNSKQLLLLAEVTHTVEGKQRQDLCRVEDWFKRNVVAVEQMTGTDSKTVQPVLWQASFKNGTGRIDEPSILCVIGDHFHCRAACEQIKHRSPVPCPGLREQAFCLIGLRFVAIRQKTHPRATLPIDGGTRANEKYGDVYGKEHNNQCQRYS